MEYAKEVSDYKNLIKTLVMGTTAIYLKPWNFQTQLNISLSSTLVLSVLFKESVSSI